MRGIKKYHFDEMILGGKINSVRLGPIRLFEYINLPWIVVTLAKNLSGYIKRKVQGREEGRGWVLLEQGYPTGGEDVCSRVTLRVCMSVSGAVAFGGKAWFVSS
jgi:hypothetical protein